MIEIMGENFLHVLNQIPSLKQRAMGHKNSEILFVVKRLFIFLVFIMDTALNIAYDIYEKNNECTVNEFLVVLVR